MRRPDLNLAVASDGVSGGSAHTIPGVVVARRCQRIRRADRHRLKSNQLEAAMSPMSNAFAFVAGKFGDAGWITVWIDKRLVPRPKNRSTTHLATFAWNKRRPTNRASSRRLLTKCSNSIRQAKHGQNPPTRWRSSQHGSASKQPACVCSGDRHYRTLILIGARGHDHR